MMQTEMIGGIFTLVGVFAGFALAEGTNLIRAFYKKRRMIKALKAEVESIIRMMPFKRDILSQAERAFRESRVLDTSSTHLPRAANEQSLNEGDLGLSPKESDCLHIAYERLRVIDAQTDNAIEYFNSVTSAHSAAHATHALSLAMEDMIKSLPGTEQLLKSYLSGKPIDVFEF